MLWNDIRTADLDLNDQSFKNKNQIYSDKQKDNGYIYWNLLGARLLAG